MKFFDVIIIGGVVGFVTGRTLDSLLC